jgi:hypothetical protein
MNRVVGYELLASELAEHQALPYHDLTQLIGPPKSQNVDQDGVSYCVTTTVEWRGDEGGEILVRTTVLEADWGNPHDLLEDQIVVSRS